MSEPRFPVGWDAERVKKLIDFHDGQSEDEDEGRGEWHEAGPGGDLQRVRREVMAEGREEDRSEDRDSERGRELLHGFQDA